MQNENVNLRQALDKKDEEARQLAEMVQEMERKMKKVIAVNKSSQKAK